MTSSRRGHRSGAVHRHQRPHRRRVQQLVERERRACAVPADRGRPHRRVPRRTGRADGRQPGRDRHHGRRRVRAAGGNPQIGGRARTTAWCSSSTSRTPRSSQAEGEPQALPADVPQLETNADDVPTGFTARRRPRPAPDERRRRGGHRRRGRRGAEGPVGHVQVPGPDLSRRQGPRRLLQHRSSPRNAVAGQWPAAVLGRAGRSDRRQPGRAGVPARQRLRQRGQRSWASAATTRCCSRWTSSRPADGSRGSGRVASGDRDRDGDHAQGRAADEPRHLPAGHARVRRPRTASARSSTGYRDQTPDAFEKMFERDKEELREIGIPIEVGSHEALFDDEPGYRIRRGAFELPEITLEPDEAAVVGLAARVWQHAGLARQTTDALVKLRAAGVAVDRDALSLVEPRLAASEPAFEPLCDAVVTAHAGALRLPAPGPRGRRAHPGALGGAVVARPLVRHRSRPRPGGTAHVPPVPGHRATVRKAGRAGLVPRAGGHRPARRWPAACEPRRRRGIGRLRVRAGCRQRAAPAGAPPSRGRDARAGTCWRCRWPTSTSWPRRSSPTGRTWSRVEPAELRTRSWRRLRRLAWHRRGGGAT